MSRIDSMSVDLTAGPIVLSGATIVDTRDGTRTSGQDIAIKDGRILDIVSTSTSPSETDAERIEATGMFVVPGFLDMHAHPLESKDPEGALALMLAFGVTGFRQMSGSPAMLAKHQHEASASSGRAPSVVAMPGSLLTPANAATAAMAVAEIRKQKAAGADFIKVGMTSTQVLFAALAEGRRLGIPVGGHLPATTDVAAAAVAGMKFIEHLGPGPALLAACSDDEVAVRKSIAARPQLKVPPFKIPFLEKIMGGAIRKRIVNPTSGAADADIAILARLVSTFSEEKATALAAVFVSNGTWQSPTLIRERTSQLCDDPEFSSDPNLRYVDPSTVKLWQDTAREFAARPLGQRATYQDLYALQCRITKLFDDAGVKMIAGSDVTGAVWEIPGYSLHQEFDELARAGLPPLRILQMATLNGAEFLGKSADLGTVTSGKAADLVLLSADPLESAQNLHSIAGVVRSGRYHCRADLETLKDRLAASRSIV
ncbi:amidohydrolase family protein [Arthrobacter sp. GMC3]|uniref:amidohydrolase family protein n=1 Tax=Arthrobacter sp. GMC3 TaxID=2058894 RepID=UPI000CE4BEA2|nr:amidohydrolase family protein [Arthrobacter sp. GMC3]